MNRATASTAAIASGLVLSFALAGCAGYVEGDGGGVVAAEPDAYFFGGYYGAGYRDRDYGRRGADSRRGGAHSGGAAPPAPAAARPAATAVVPAVGRSGGHSEGGGRR